MVLTLTSTTHRHSNLSINWYCTHHCMGNCLFLYESLICTRQMSEMLHIKAESLTVTYLIQCVMPGVLLNKLHLCVNGHHLEWIAEEVEGPFDLSLCALELPISVELKDVVSTWTWNNCGIIINCVFWGVCYTSQESLRHQCQGAHYFIICSLLIDIDIRSVSQLIKISTC